MTAMLDVGHDGCVGGVHKRVYRKRYFLGLDSHKRRLCQLDMGRYDTFIASITVNKPSKRANHGGHHTVRPYVSIICPYCNNEFQEVVLERLKAKKSSICKAHLAQCPAYRILTQKAHDEMADSREEV